jgi:SAM-dependent methyltransferase
MVTVSSGADYYRVNYPDYERQNSRRKLDFYVELVRRWVPDGGRVHEIGVGLGAFVAHAGAVFTCSGSEVNAFGLEEARRRAPKAALTAGSSEAIPNTPPVDAVVAWDVLEHIPDLDAALDVIAARLPAEGVLIAMVPVYDGPLGWLVERLDHDPTHVSKWPRGRWLQTLEAHGFEVLATGGAIRRLLFGRWYLHVTAPAWLWRHAGSAFWFVARAPGASGVSGGGA